MKTAMLLLVLCDPVAAAEVTGLWLDKPLVNWNKPGAALPQAPASSEAPGARCGATLRPASGKEDKAIMAAGWSLVGPMQSFGKVRAFLATAGVDGMCRPEAFQGFVFVEGQLAGTLAPQPMRSRSDGTLSLIRLLSAENLLAEFARYLDQDPLCCPSRTLTVHYRIDATPDGALLVPFEASTTPR
jgi:hypothetical protein